MVWHSPFTFTAGHPLSANELNQYLYDNMRHTLAGRLKTDLADTGRGTWIVTDAVNSAVPREVKGIKDDGTVIYAPGTTSYFDVTGWSAGSPFAVTTTTGTRAMVIISLHSLYTIYDPSLTGAPTTSPCKASFRVSGASTIASSDTRCLKTSGVYPFGAGGSSNDLNTMGAFHISGLTPGVNTFTLQIAKPTTPAGSTQIWLTGPSLAVIPLG